MFVIGMDSKVGEKYLGLGDSGRDEHTWNGMEWGEQRGMIWRRRRRKKGETETKSETLNSAPK